MSPRQEREEAEQEVERALNRADIGAADDAMVQVVRAFLIQLKGGDTNEVSNIARRILDLSDRIDSAAGPAGEYDPESVAWARRPVLGRGSLPEGG